LRLAHGNLLGLMRRRDKAKGGEAAMALAKRMLAWCPIDNIGVRLLLGDIALLQGDHQVAMKEYLKGAPNSPPHWYQAALIAFREGDYVAACSYLRRGIAANPYIAEGLTGRTVLSEHLYWHASNVHGPEWAVEYLDSAACDWTPEEIDFVDWVFNASPVLKERAEMMALHEGMTYERDAEKRAPYAQRSLDFIDRITDTLSKKMVRRVKNRWGVEIWPWDRAGFQRPTNRSLQ
jgi:tetratricopeptide (TPR) repeat protein